MAQKMNVDGVEKVEIECNFSNGQKIAIKANYQPMLNSLDLDFEGEDGDAINFKEAYCVELERFFLSLSEVFRMATSRDLVGETLDANEIIKKRDRMDS